VNASAVGAKRVLVVEDDELFRRSLAGFVSAMGYVALPAQSAEEALVLSSQGNVDLVLTDYQLIHENGLDLIRVLRARGMNVPTILLSGYLSDEVRAQAQGMAIAAILKKPGDIALLGNVLPELLGEAS
jgi:DNA-binding response OmpR family regulator